MLIRFAVSAVIGFHPTIHPIAGQMLGAGVRTIRKVVVPDDAPKLRSAS